MQTKVMTVNNSQLYKKKQDILHDKAYTTIQYAEELLPSAKRTLINSHL